MTKKSKSSYEMKISTLKHSRGKNTLYLNYDSEYKSYYFTAVELPYKKPSEIKLEDIKQIDFDEMSDEYLGSLIKALKKMRKKIKAKK